MARHIRNFLSFANRVLQEQPVVWMEREIPSSRVIHPKFQKHRFATMNSVTEDLHNLYHNPYKIKSFLQVLNSRLAVISAFRKEYSIFNYITPLMAFSLGLGGYYIYRMVLESQKDDSKFNLTKKSTSGLKYVVSKFVLYNERIINETAKMIKMLCDRERIQYMTMHAVSRVLDMKPVVKSTEKLTKDYLHKDLMYDESIRNKLKGIIIKQLNDEARRADLLKLLLNFMKSEQARDLFTESVVSSISTPESRRETVKACMNFVHNKLDDPNMKTNMRNKLDSYFVGGPKQ